MNLFSTLRMHLQLFPDFGEDFEIPPGGRGVWFLMMVGLEDEIARRKQRLFDIGVLLHLFPRGFDDQPVMLAWLRWLVLEVPAFETDPIDAHFFHVAKGKVTRALGFEGRHLRHLVASGLPLQARERCPWIVWTFRIQHRLPQTFEAGIALAMKHKRRSGEIRKQSQVRLPLRKNDFAGLGCMRKNLPIRSALLRYGLPPS